MRRFKDHSLFLLGLWAISSLAWWTFAFWPAADNQIEWLRAAQYACFGSGESGLPDAGGWLMLVATPLTFLLALAIVFGKEILAEGLSRFRQGLSFRLFIVIGIFAVQIGWISSRVLTVYKDSQQDFSFDRQLLQEPFPASYPKRNVVVQNFNLVDHRGNAFHLGGMLSEHRALVVTFAFANCKTICPAIVGQMKEAALSVDPRKARFVVITLDPRRDTPRSIAQWAKRLSLPEHAHLLSGDVSEVESVLRNFEVPFKRDLKTGDIQHPPVTHVLSSQGRIVYSLSNVPSSWLAAAVDEVNALSQ
jgi:cytochrome oxidase Cu insertion factor (SCO1/SenC/PrrC family)